MRKLFTLLNGILIVSVLQAQTPTNDEPCGAINVPVSPSDPINIDCTPSTVYSYTNATLTPGIPNPTCGFIAAPNNIRDVWYKCIVPASGNLIFRLGLSTALYDMTMSAYSATACNGSFTEIACNDDYIDLYPRIQLSNLNPGSTIFFRVYRFANSTITNAEMKICASDYYSNLPVVDNNNKVGIGTQTPLAKLDVAGTSIFRDSVIFGKKIDVRLGLKIPTNAAANKVLVSDASGNASWQTLSAISGQWTSSGTHIYNANTGNIGIGENSPGFPLNFSAALGDKISLYGNSGSHYGFGVQGGLLQMHSDAAAASIAFGYGSSASFTERARIINQGEYGMSLTGRLQLSTGTNSAGLWLNNFANTASPAFIGMAADDRVGFFGALGWGLTMNTATSNVGIGLNTANPTRPLSFPATLGEKILLYPGAVGEVGIGVYGGELRLHCDIPSGKVSFGTQDNAGVFSENALAQRNGAFAFSILGSLWVNGTTYASDERFKQNITAIQSPLQKLLQINGVEYEMKTKEFSKNHFVSGRQIGLLAQNVEKVIPEAVNEKDGYKGVDYAKLVPLLIEAIKEQNKKMDDQAQKMIDLQKQIEELKTIITQK